MAVDENGPPRQGSEGGADRPLHPDGGADRPLRLAILGSTGSIGRQAIDVAMAHPGELEVVALAAAQSSGLLVEQAAQTGARLLALANPQAAGTAVPPAGASMRFGDAAVVELAGLDDVDCVLNALVGAAGLRASLAALQSGKRLALANKESLVAGGDLLMPLAIGGQLVPVDSEHSAIHQCLVGEAAGEVRRIWLTASGGPFRGWPRDRLADAQAADALAHPTWNMGHKITIDSATLMNKGLEVIEAMHLFGLDVGQVKVVVHPQSVIHSMVEFHDGSVKAHLGPADMRIPIQYAFSHPRRWPSLLTPLDFTSLGTLEFAAPDTEAFGCLRLALQAAEAGGTAPAVLSAANEVAVAAFLAGGIGFLDIEQVVESVLAQHHREPVSGVEQLEAHDQEARRLAQALLERRHG
jgi:1-deoxy-D-xylulose-5-phosphate reductoisomerase